MSVIKDRDMTADRYIRSLAESGGKISDIERVEVSGYLLRECMEGHTERALIFQDMMAYDNFILGDVIASVLVAESPDSIHDLLKMLKTIVTDYYETHIDMRVKEELDLIEEEKPNRDPFAIDCEQDAEGSITVKQGDPQ